MNETKRPGGKPATINDIARLAEVSKKTVSRVINHSPFVKEETREPSSVTFSVGQDRRSCSERSRSPRRSY